MPAINALYMRVCEMNIAGRLLSSPPMTLEFEYEFSASGVTNAKAKVINASPETIAVAKKDAICTISAGYAADYGSVFTGVIEKSEYAPGRDSVLSLSLVDKSERFAQTVINRAWKGPIKASQVIQDLFSIVGITSSKIDLASDINYERGFSSLNLTLRKALTNIAKDCGSQLFFRQGQCCILSPETGFSTAWELSPATGLLSATQTDKGYKIKTLFLYRLGSGSLVTLKRKDTSVKLRVSKGKLVFSPKGNTGAEIEAVRI